VKRRAKTKAGTQAPRRKANQKKKEIKEGVSRVVSRSRSRMSIVKKKRSAVRPTPSKPRAPEKAKAREFVVVAIDGPVGSGKSTIARELANRLGFLHLNTGMTYRLLAAAALEQGIPLDEAALVSLAGRLQMSLDADGVHLVGTSLTRDINSPLIADIASKIATLEGVRRSLVSLQRALVKGRSVVAEGRDTTTVVFPDATLKIFLTAREEVRARRRQAQLREVGVFADFAEVLEWLRERDRRDSTRAHSPLRIARDTIVVDTSDSTAEEIVEEIARRLKAI
jgi:cytidylate kinase